MPAAAEQVADVERADDEEEAGAHQQREDRVDDPDDVLPPSPDVEEHPPLAASANSNHRSWVEGLAIPPAALGVPKARAIKILNSNRTSRGTISISIETGSTPGSAAATIAIDQVGVAAVLSELLDADDAEPGDGEDRQRQLEDDAAGEHRASRRSCSSRGRGPGR